MGIKLKSAGAHPGQNWVVVERVFPEGNIAKDGRLRPGDRIFKVGKRVEEMEGNKEQLGLQETRL